MKGNLSESNSQWGTCIGAVYPLTEVCDGKDNDCNGQVDESLPDVINDIYGSDSVGECKVQVERCLAGTYQIIQQAIGPATEVCDNKDNNCNGQIDETICGKATDKDCGNINDCTADKCLGTKMPESIPTEKLVPNSYAEIDNDLIFETVINGKKGAQFIDGKYTLQSTYGCSCEQILKCKPGQTKGEYKQGCSEGTMKVWISQQGWASSCS